MMPNKLRTLIPLILTLAATGLALAQATPSEPFSVVRVLGEPRPQRILYNQPLDQFAWVVPGGTLQLVDATRYEVQHTLYQARTYSVYAFSDDGTLFAVAIDRTVDLWDTRTGDLLETFEPEGILGIQGPLTFADDNGLLVVNSVVPAPQEIRRSENDTSILPWLWDIPNALGTGRSSLPGQVSALPFFDYRNGFILGDNDKVIAARPGRLEVLDVGTTERNVVLAEIDSDRFERDPVDAWRSIFSDALYVQPRGRNITHIDSRNGRFVDIPQGFTTGITNTGPQAQALYNRLLQNNNALPIGEASPTEYNSLMALFFSQNYRDAVNGAPLHVTLVDVLDPISPTAANNRLILYIYNEATESGDFRHVIPDNVTKTAINPQRTQIAFYFGRGEIEVYDIASGDIVRVVEPIYPDSDGRALMAFSPDGTELIYDFQRFNLETGAVILQDLNVRGGFGEFYFSDDDRRINTIESFGEGGNILTWWQWDITTGEIVRRETVELNGTTLDQNDERSRFLLQRNEQILGETRTVIEVADVTSDDRQRLILENFPNAPLEFVNASPDWRHVMAFHNEGGQVALALYSFADGLRWYMSAENIPGTFPLEYFWQNNNTFVIQPDNPDDNTILTTAVFGVDAHPTGLPQCLVDAFPDGFNQWVPVWERRTFYLTPTQLIDLSKQVCDVLPADAVTVDEILTTPTPTAVPTRESRTAFRATVPALAYVPTCITQNFTREAEEYADVWRTISAGLGPGDTAELEQIICEGFGSTGDVGGGGGDPGSPVLMQINIETAARSLTRSPDVRPANRAPRSHFSLALVMRAYERETGRALDRPRLSNNGRLLAHYVNGGYIQIERLNRPYEDIAAAATATQSVFASQTPKVPFISLQPTATPTSEVLGLPLPTITPTITPTTPPLFPADNPFPEADMVTDFCEPNAKLYSLENPPPDFAPPGVLLTFRNDFNGLWTLDPVTGNTFRDDTLPICYEQGTCNTSADRQFLLRGNTVTRPDGADARDLLELTGIIGDVNVIEWIPGTSQVRIRYNAPPEPVTAPLELETYEQVYDAATGTVATPFIVPTTVPYEGINGLPTEILVGQPVQRRYWIVQVPFDTGGSATGYTYYLVDRETDETTVLTRRGEHDGDNSIFAEWTPDGRLLYFSPQDGTDTLYGFQPGSGALFVYSGFSERRLPIGTYSNDGHYRYTWRRPAPDDLRALVEAELPVPHIEVYNMETRATRRYCVPELNDSNIGGVLQHAPDGRYLAFISTLPARLFDTRPTPIPGPGPTATPFYGLPDSEPERLSRVQRTFILDLQTGSVTEVGQGQRDIRGWIIREAE